MISRMDRDIGIIMQKLGDLEMLENTLVIFTSDNGPMPDVEFTEFFNSNSKYRDGKRFLYLHGVSIHYAPRSIGCDWAVLSEVSKISSAT